MDKIKIISKLINDSEKITTEVQPPVEDLIHINDIDEFSKYEGELYYFHEYKTLYMLHNQKWLVLDLKKVSIQQNKEEKITMEKPININELNNMIKEIQIQINNIIDYIKKYKEINDKKSEKSIENIRSENKESFEAMKDDINTKMDSLKNELIEDMKKQNE